MFSHNNFFSDKKTSNLLYTGTYDRLIKKVQVEGFLILSSGSLWHSIVVSVFVLFLNQKQIQMTIWWWDELACLLSGTASKSVDDRQNNLDNFLEHL